MTPRDRRALIWGGSILVGAVVLLRVVPAVAGGYRHRAEELRARAELLAHARAELAETPILRDTTATLTRALIALAPKLLVGTTTAEAMADLSGRLALAATRHEVKLERTDPVSDSSITGRLHRLQLHVALTSDVRGLVRFLDALVGGDAILTVEALRVMAVDPTSPNRVPEVLRVELTVSGWYLGPTLATRGGS